MRAWQANNQLGEGMMGPWLTIEERSDGGGGGGGGGVDGWEEETHSLATGRGNAIG